MLCMYIYISIICIIYLSDSSNILQNIECCEIAEGIFINSICNFSLIFHLFIPGLTFHFCVYMYLIQYIYACVYK